MTAARIDLAGAGEGWGTRLLQAAGDALVITRRNLTHVRNMPEKLTDVTVQPVIFVLLFTYVFGAAIVVPDGSYKEFLMAGIFAQTVAFTCAGTAISMADDMAKGVIDRFRSLPMARSAVLMGRTGADLAQAVIGVAFLAGTGLAVGWRVHEGLLSALGGFALLLLFGYAMSWLGVLVGMLVRAADAAQAIMFITLFPITFVSNVFVPTEGMPDWLQAVAEWNPVSAVAAAGRELFGNPQAPVANPPWPLEHPILTSVLWSLVILAICVPLAVRRYRTKTTR